MVQLKNEEAQKLLEMKTIEIDGVEINLWQGHTRDSVTTQQSWNKIISYAELNFESTGENGIVVFSGVMQVTRNEAACYASKLGFLIADRITKNTDYIVVGSENVGPNKVEKVLRYNEQGSNIQFIDEMTFLEIALDNIPDIEFVTKDYFQPKEQNKSSKNKKPKPIKKILPKSNSNKLEGLSIIASGKLQNFSRDEIKQTIEENGGKPVSSISSKTNYLIAGENIGPNKLEKAQKLNIPIISEDEFLKMID